MNPRLTDSIRKAWVEGLEEFIALNPVGEKSMLTNLIQVITNIRVHHLLREGKNESFVRRVFDDIRNIPEFYILLMSATTSFMQELDDVTGAINHFCFRTDMYNTKSNVVDTTTLSRQAPVGSLAAILTDNPWLFMLCAASTLERDTVGVLVKHGLNKAPR
jgi:hypothetical protein